MSVGAGIKMFDISDISAHLIFVKWNLILSYIFLSPAQMPRADITFIRRCVNWKHPCSRSSNGLPFAMY
jgi:hypothetical protein